MKFLSIGPPKFQEWLRIMARKAQLEAQRAGGRAGPERLLAVPGPHGRSQRVQQRARGAQRIGQNPVGRPPAIRLIKVIVL